ncbi:hypothetical protein ACPB9E_04950 [Streptomyces exfoliatus]|uniref:hypothetical protein n=1 Tax=Streptomyces exfoliatus TaxID=1905 RepID=UPI003C2BF2F0
MAEPDIPNLIADLKITVVQGHIRQIMEHVEALRDSSQHFAYLKEKIDEIHKEVVKNPVTEYWEAAGFDGIAAGIEKLYEGEGLGTAVNYWLSNGAGAFAAIVIGGIGLYLAGKLTNIQRSIQAAVRPSGLIRAYNANGDVTLQSRRDVEDRERRVANGGTGVADLVSNPANAEQARKLREQLVPLNKAVGKFDRLAPSFLESFRKLPSERKAEKAANGVTKISDAVKLVDRPALKEVAESVEKLNKETGLASTARKMGELTTKTETLRQKFQDLRGTISNLDQTIAGTTG